MPDKNAITLRMLDQSERLETASSKTGIHKADLVRQAVDEFLTRFDSPKSKMDTQALLDAHFEYRKQKSARSAAR